MKRLLSRQFMRKPLILSGILVSALCQPIAQASAETLLPSQTVQELIVAQQEKSFDSFNKFLKSVQKSELAKSNPELKKTLSLYRRGKALSEEQSHEIQRLLGVYTRIKYGKQAVETLAELVAIPTFRDSRYEQHDNPNFHELAKRIEELATDFGLAFKNVDNRVYEITLPGASEELVGIHAHSDVVPVNPDNWVLEDGTKLDPFKLTKIGDRMYGRGAEDDKNGIVVTLYAMKVIQEEGIKLNRTFRLLVDTTEETSSTAIPYYFERHPTPDYNLALDGGYPVVIAEKGYGTVMASFPARTATGKGMEVIKVTGGLATNQIPRESIATILADDLVATREVLNQQAQVFVKEYGSNFSIDVDIVNDQILLKVKGVSAHSSDPGSGVNPVSRMMLLLNRLNGQLPVKQNHIIDAAEYAASNWGLNYLGGKLNIGFSDEFMGPLTTSLTYVSVDDAEMKIATNLRVPVGKKPDYLKAEILEKVGQWQETTKTPMNLDISIAEPMYRNPQGRWVNALLDVATENLNLPREFSSSAGATSVHYLPNGVQFGLAEPGTKYTGHNANEFKTDYQFLLDLQVVTEMMMRVGQLEQLN